jgi:hypothetical protein
MGKNFQPAQMLCSFNNSIFSDFQMIVQSKVSITKYIEIDESGKFKS